MTHQITVSLPHDLYVALSSQAANEGEPLPLHLSKLLAASLHLPVECDAITDQEKADSRRQFEACFGLIDDGEYSDSDNERIDADLAREYGSTHDG